MNVIFDIDGTIADDSHRKHFLLDGDPNMKDWESYYRACVYDELLPAGLILQDLYDMGHRIYLLTGRNEIVKNETVQWLDDHNLNYDELRMREERNYEPDYVMKIRWARELNLTPENTLCVFEDRARVVEAWRKAGFHCMQVASGNF